MVAPPENSTEEIQRLQRCISDLGRLLAVPALWGGGDASQVVCTLLEVVLAMLSLDFICVQLKGQLGATPIEMVRLAGSHDLPGRQRQILDILSRWAAQDPEAWPGSVWIPSGQGDMAIAPARLGLQGEMGVIVAGSRRANFPGETDRLVLRVAANLAAMALQEARLLSERAKADSELDQRVEQRTAELVAGNRELRRSEIYLAEAQKLSHTGSFGWNVSRGQIFWSEETFRIFGYEAAPNITLEMVLKRVHPDDRALVERVTDRAGTHREAFDIEHRLLLPDGSVKHLHVVAHALEDESEDLHFAGAVMDITTRRQTEEALRRSEQRYRHLFHHMPVALWQLNAREVLELFKRLRSEGVVDLGAYFDAHPGLVQRCMEMLMIEEVNEHTVQMLGGRDASEFVGTSIARYFPENSDTFRRSMVSRYRGDPNYAAETRLFRLDGRVADVLYTASRVGPTSEPGMSLLGVIDITERKQVEEAMRRSEQRYRLLFHNVPFALWQIDAQPLVAMLNQLRAQGVKDLSAYLDDHPELLADAIGAQQFEEVNDYAVHFFGARDRNELLGTSPWAWLKSVDILRRAVESRWRGEEFYQEATKLETRRGRVIDALFFTARPQMSEGLPITFIGVIDLTNQVRAEEELRRLRADFAHAARISMLGELTASIAHEVNQPLAAIAAGGEASLRWLDRPTPDVHEVRDLTKRVVADARRASAIIARIRTMASRRVPELTLLSLDELIREALVFLHHELEARSVGVSHFPAFGAQKVFVDRTQLQQVIVNLTVNAIQAMAHAGTNRRINFRTEVPDGHTLRCWVEDSGPGIEPQHLTRLFDSFFTTKDSGMGMGLRICRSVIEAHGGRIEADNESTLGGARFSFTLPAGSKS